MLEEPPHQVPWIPPTRTTCILTGKSWQHGERQTSHASKESTCGSEDPDEAARDDLELFLNLGSDLHALHRARESADAGKPRCIFATRLYQVAPYPTSPFHGMHLYFLNVGTHLTQSAGDNHFPHPINPACKLKQSPCRFKIPS